MAGIRDHKLGRDDMAAQSTTLSKDEREFLQRRVGGFGLFVGSSFLFFLVYRTIAALVLDLPREFRSPSYWYHLISAVCFFGTWVVCRVRPLSRRAIRAVETTGLLSGVTAATLMGMHIPVEGRPDFVLLLALTYTVVGHTMETETWLDAKPQDSRHSRPMINSPVTPRKNEECGRRSSAATSLVPLSGVSAPKRLPASSPSQSTVPSREVV